ncbi:MAG: ABC transporter ATP-binding protein [Firmicutes bacterium]|nr:ABC transporter ATP-binding protein [Bacillota bacterium]
MEVIKTRGLTKIYGAKIAVADLDLSVQRGSVFGFLGPNGSGKSTTVKMLLGLRTPSRGTAQVLGFDSSRESHLIGQRVGYVPELGNLYPHWTVQATIELVRGLRPTWDDSFASHLLSLFELPLKQRVGKLSKGMQRQLALLLAMAPRPELLILDEPTSGLDPIKRQEFLQVLMEGVADTGQTVFFSSHNMTEVERVADTIGILYNGRLVVSGALEELKCSVKRIRVVLPNRDSLQLQQPVRSIEGDNGQWILTVERGVEKVLAELRTMEPVALQVYDLALEDIFMIYGGGEGHEPNTDR